MNQKELTGQTRTHVRQYEEPRFAAHVAAADAFFEMRAAALRQGIDIQPFSAFRDFQAQVRIWNMKFSGERPLYAMDGSELNTAIMETSEIIHHILRWSALPGASRHHWGTDIDVIDQAAVPDGYRVRLLPEETQAGGVFCRLHQWLDQNMRRFGFFRPYAVFSGGIYPEPWHISYAPVSRIALERFSLEMLETTIAKSDIQGREIIESMLPEIFKRYILNITPPETNG